MNHPAALPEATSPATRNAVVLIAVILGGFALYWLRGILTPLVMAIFLMVLIDGFARVLDHRIPGVSTRFSRPLALIVSILLFVGSVYLLADNARAFVGQMAGYGPKLQALITQGAHAVGIAVPPTLDELIQRLNPERLMGAVAQTLQGVLSDSMFVLIYLGFLLASRYGFRRKLVTLFPTRDSRDDAVEIFTRVRNGIERYVWVQTVTGLIIAAAVWVLMAAVGLDNAFFWAFFIFLTSYIPIVGGLIGTVAPPLFALLEFDSWWQAALLFAGSQLIFFVVGNVVTPRMQGVSLNLDPVAVLLSLAFWGAIWGAPGAFLSSPLTVVVMVILMQFPGTRWVAVLLSWDGNPERGEQSDDPSDPPQPQPRLRAKSA
ncbi:MAG TPA: AI-2E family transporter [Caulobacteraceae bacterium]|jgi:predicted PurR-regulated permease PerM